MTFKMAICKECGEVVAYGDFEHVEYHETKDGKRHTKFTIKTIPKGPKPGEISLEELKLRYARSNP